MIIQESIFLPFKAVGKSTIEQKHIHLQGQHRETLEAVYDFICGISAIIHVPLLSGISEKARDCVDFDGVQPFEKAGLGESH